MKKRSASKLLLFFLPAVVFFSLNQSSAQQQSVSADAAPYASVADSASVAAESSVPTTAAVLGTTSDAKLSSAGEAASARSAGTAAMKRGEAGAWSAGAGSFKSSSAYWIAGRNAFSLERQQGGVWRAQPSNIPQTAAAVPASLAPDLYAVPAAPSPKLPGGRKGSSPYRAQRFGSGYHGSPAGPRGAKFPSRGKNSLASPYTSHYSSLGAGHGTNPGTLANPSSESLTLPSLNGTLDPGSIPK
jgi:hypothetical protein